MKNYTLGRGELHFSRFVPNTRTPAGFSYIGNTPEVSLNIESEQLDHYDADHGIREKDDSVDLEVNRTGSFMTDNISPENVSLFFFGDSIQITQAAAAANTETLTVKRGKGYKLGVTTSNPAGVFGLENVSAEVSGGGTALVEGVDYTLDEDAGMIWFLIGSDLAVDDEEIDVTYDVRAHTRDRVISGNKSVEGAMMYRSYNPKGSDAVIYMPYMKVSPAGDYNLKGDEWQMIPMNLEILKLPNQAAIYRDGLPAYTG